MLYKINHDFHIVNLLKSLYAYLVHHHHCVMPKGRSLTAKSGTKAAVLPKGRSSTTNSRTMLQFSWGWICVVASRYFSQPSWYASIISYHMRQIIREWYPFQFISRLTLYKIMWPYFLKLKTGHLSIDFFNWVYNLIIISVLPNGRSFTASAGTQGCSSAEGKLRNQGCSFTRDE